MARKKARIEGTILSVKIDCGMSASGGRRLIWRRACSELATAQPWKGLDQSPSRLAEMWARMTSGARSLGGQFDTTSTKSAPSPRR